MFGNFFNNLASGKISGWGIGALIAAAYMVFGRTGLLGKVGGALMAMMIGSNSQRQTQTVAQAENQEMVQDEQQQRNRHR